MKSKTHALFYSQVKDLADIGLVSIKTVGSAFEVTFWPNWGGINHSHYTGNTLAEAMNRAWLEEMEDDE